MTLHEAIEARYTAQTDAAARDASERRAARLARPAGTGPTSLHEALGVAFATAQHAPGR
ncbi:hypothetical protein [Actinomadura nitritigenes]|uniref:hypothetical protein n=1 Tax=Actinomadura nitritigenes TaxID=134602 RepID=UPI003D8FC673